MAVATGTALDESAAGGVSGSTLHLMIGRVLTQGKLVRRRLGDSIVT